MTFEKWIRDNNGKYIDYDNVYGVQCVDLIKDYIKNVLNIQPQSIGNAIEYYNKRYLSNYLTVNFIWIDNTPAFIPQLGDIGVLKTSSGKGHVVVCSGVGTTSWFNCYEQNTDGKGSGMKLNKRGYTNFLGVLRPINQNPLKKGYCNLFVTNATINHDCEVYCDNLTKNKIGKVNKGERVKRIKICKSDSIIMYSVTDKMYKTGIIKSKYITMD